MKRIVDTIIIAAFAITMAVALVGWLTGCAATTAGVAVAPAAVVETEPAERLVQRLLGAPEQVAEVGGVIYAVGIGESRDMQFALNQGENVARGRIARFVAGGANEFSVTLRGSRIELRKVEEKEGGGYRAVVLMTMPAPAASSQAQEGGMIMPQ